MSKPASSLTLSLASLVLAPSALASSPSPALDQVHTFRYEIRALGGEAGEAVLTLGAEKAVEGKKLRPVRIEAKTGGLAAKLYKAWGDATAWVDRLGLPAATAWKATSPTGAKEGKAKFTGKRVDGEYTLGTTTKPVKAKLPERALDVTSAFAWALGLDLTEGRIEKKALFDGRRFFALEAKVGKASDLTLPIGLREAVPILITVTRGKVERRLVYWVGKADRVPYKLEFQYGTLGDVEALLVQMKVEKPAA